MDVSWGVQESHNRLKWESLWSIQQGRRKKDYDDNADHGYVWIHRDDQNSHIKYAIIAKIGRQKQKGDFNGQANDFIPIRLFQ